MKTVGFIAISVCFTLAGSDGLEPAESMRQIQLDDDLKIELIASEPDIVSPVAMAWDEFGRMYVVEMRDYPNGPGTGKPHLSRVKLLSDRAGDGRYETVSVFADELPFANGVMPWQGGVIVTAAPDIWFLKDSDGDGRADIKQPLFTGFKEGNPQLRVNHPTLGIDHWIYVANGLSGGEVRRADSSDDRKIPIPQMDFRFRPDRTEFEATSGNAQFGLTFDDFANRFVCSNRQHIAHVVFPDRYLKRNPFLGVTKTVLDVPDHGAAARIFPIAMTRTTAVEHAGTFTAACGVLIYRGTALPERYRGNSFVCDPTGYLVHRDVLAPAGPTFIAKRAADESRREFIASTDEWFRPVNLANGPDGALYLVDMYRETIEHPQYMPKGLAETLDLRKGDDRGRIYRITGRSSRTKIERWPGQLTSRELVDALNNPNSWWRETAQRLLIDRADPSVTEPLQNLAKSDADPTARAHALWTLEALGRLSDDAILSALHCPEAIVREHAVRLAESRIRSKPALADKITAMAGGSDVRVRFQVALTLGELGADANTSRAKSGAPRVQSLAKLVASDGEDPWFQVAILSSAAGVAGELWRALDTEFLRAPTAARAAFIERIGTIIGARRDPAELGRFVSTFTSRTSPDDMWWQLAALNGLSAGVRPSGKTLNELIAGLNEPDRLAEPRVRQLLGSAAKIACQGDRSVAERTAAVQLAINLPFAEFQSVVRELLEPTQPNELQLAAVQAAANVNNPAVAPLLLDHWSALSPPVRREVIEAIFSRRERIDQLLDAIAANKLKASDLDLHRHQQLLTHGTKEIRDRAISLFQDEGTPNRKDVIESYRGVLAQVGDRQRGQEVFKKNCETCHQIAGNGHRVGPELTGLRTRNKEALLMDILDPNRALEPNYANYLVVTKDGRMLSGIIASETATSITLRRAEGVEDTLLRQDVEQIRASGQSLMPEGLERTVSQAEMVDLLEFLQSVP